MGTFPSQLDFVPLVQALLGHAKQNTPPLPVESTQVQEIPPHGKENRTLGESPGEIIDILLYYV
jgi:hypothetical protein